MATNVSERDKAMHEVMGLIDKQLAHVVHLEHFGPNAQGQYTALLILKGQIESMLGYSGSMPSEVPKRGRKMIYLIVANQIMDVLTDMDEALEQARHYAPKVGDITVADMATGRKLIVTADGKATDMDANMRAVNR